MRGRARARARARGEGEGEGEGRGRGRGRGRGARAKARENFESEHVREQGRALLWGIGGERLYKVEIEASIPYPPWHTTVGPGVGTAEGNEVPPRHIVPISLPVVTSNELVMISERAAT